MSGVCVCVQVATDTRLWLYSQLIDIRVSLQELITVATNRAEAEADVLMPGGRICWGSSSSKIHAFSFLVEWFPTNCKSCMVRLSIQALPHLGLTIRMPVLCVSHVSPPSPAASPSPSSRRLHPPSAGPDGALGPLAHVPRGSLAA